MDTLLEKCSSSMNEFQFDHQSVPLCSSQSTLVNELAPSSNISSDGDSHPEGNDYQVFSNVILKYISEMLLEEDLEGKTCMLQDCMALQDAERSFYDVLGAKYPPSPNKRHASIDQDVDGPDDVSTHNSSNCSSTANNLLESNWVRCQGEFESCHARTPFIDNSLMSTSLSTSQSSSTLRSFCDSVDGLEDSLVSTLSATNIPPNGNCVIVDLDPEENTPEIVGEAEKERRYDNSPIGSNGRKNHHREDGDSLEEGRKNKHSAIYTDLSEQLEMFDKVLLCTANDDSTPCTGDESLQNWASRRLQYQNGQSKGSDGRTTRGKKKGNKREMVDLNNLLTLCAEAVAGNDHKTANELLKQIRQHSSPHGDGFQRMAHYFANALEARLDCTRTQLYTVLAAKTPAADILKAHHQYVVACPFTMMSNFFANRKIFYLAAKATRLHIIDFGITYGSQWPCLIQRLSSERAGGPPKIRITGIELPQPGFRPAERVEETGHRLANYCERFNVPFEYVAIAQKWETIRFEDLKIDRDELLVVNCMYRMGTLLDETVVVNNPRDAVLKLIKKINPDIFIHGVINGNYNAAFFARRFRETLFHYSALFDMFDSTVPRENQERMLFEKEIFGRDAMNIIACEGSQRINRPETYKQWQVRNVRAGFRQLPLDRSIVRKVKAMVKAGYHKDFVVDEDGQWLLQGWKGRIVHAISYWKPC